MGEPGDMVQTQYMLRGLYIPSGLEILGNAGGCRVPFICLLLKAGESRQLDVYVRVVGEILVMWLRRGTRLSKLQKFQSHILTCFVFFRGGGPAAGPGSGGGSSAGPVPRTAAGAQEPAGSGADLRVLFAL